MCIGPSKYIYRSTQQFLFRFSEPPEAPRNLEVIELSHHAIGIEWALPRHDGGAPIRNYVVERRQGFSSRFVPVARGSVYDTYYRDTTVYEGMTYEYRVAAENEAGVSAFTAPTGPILVQDLIGTYFTLALSH